MKGVLLDVENEGHIIKLFIKNTETRRIEEVIDESFYPYFYVLNADPNEIKKIGGGIRKVETRGEVLKIIVEKPSDVPTLREKVKEFGEIREYDIPYVQRYLIDKGIKPMKRYEWVLDGNKLVSFEEHKGEWTVARKAFDIETYNPQGMPRPNQDPIIMASFWDDNSGKVFTWKDAKESFVKVLADEKSLIEKINEELSSSDVVYTYNGDNFDLPYVKKRGDKYKIESVIELRRGGQRTKARLRGRVHIDAYIGVNFLMTIGWLKLPRYTLEDVYKEFTGKKKMDMEMSDLWRDWKNGTIDKVTNYSLQDAEAAYVIGERLLPIYVELCKLVGQTMFDVSRMSASQLVELLLLKKAFQKGQIAPNKPTEDEFKDRIRKPIKGAFVKQPEPGLHENLAVLDFRSLYPSIIISHNVSPETLNCECCKDDGYVSPNGYRFCKRKKGLIPEMLEELITKRVEVKRLLKEAKDHEEKKRLDAEQQALKIIANATYGYTLFARARWYSRECGEAITAWGRHYVQDLINKAEQAGFKVLYADTDSCFLEMGNKTKEDVLNFLREYNRNLPKAMELELEGFYPRGIFVTKREGGAAKKRYALIREDGQVEITGLEFVRRDWSPIAKKTQEKVIRAVLENKIEEAKKIVKDTIKAVREGKVPLEDLVIYTQLKRGIDKYDAIGPHVRAAKRLEESGVKVEPGMTIGYVVTRGAGNIGDRSYPVQLVGSRKPDAEYYVNHQILPAVMKILGEVGIKEDDLRIGGKQSKLGAWT